MQKILQDFDQIVDEMLSCCGTQAEKHLVALAIAAIGGMAAAIPVLIAIRVATWIMESA